MTTNSVITFPTLGQCVTIFQSNSNGSNENLLSAELFDVAIIGAGVVGCAMARRFTLEGAKVAIVEKATDILDGASKANSAILHTGFDAPAGSVELACIQEGYREYEEIRGSLGLVQDMCGAYVVAWTPEELEALAGIEKQAHTNGIKDVHHVDSATLRAAEPNLSTAALGAVSVPRESLIDPWSAPYVYLEQAIQNGAQAFMASTVTGGALGSEGWTLETSRGTLRARTVINCAGLYGDLLDRDVLGHTEFQIKPRKGQFVVFDKAASALVNAVILPVPTQITKGIVLFRTVFGNLVVGPTAEEQDSRADASTDEETLRALIADGIAKVPALADMPVTATYAGLRPASERKEYRITAAKDKNWITVGGIRSTGLSASLGIAQHVYRLYQDFDAKHDVLEDPQVPNAHNLAQIANRDWQCSGHGNIVCHCELVTRREIEAALQGPLAARSLGGLKRQTRVMMGRCQGFYCSAQVAELSDGKFDTPMSEALAHG